MAGPPVTDLLLDLPNEEPWYELKFQLRELDVDLLGILEQLRRLEAQLGVKSEAQALSARLRHLYFEIDHDSEAHAPRAVQLAQCLLTLPPEAIPPWGDEAGAHRFDFDIPSDILACRSLAEAQARVFLHQEQTFSAVQRAREAVLRAADLRGSRHQVLLEVLREATLCCRTLQDEAWTHARSAYQWSEPYWRLCDPESASAHDARLAEAELAALKEDR
ncbi:hypothetical protein [Archangium sp.]|jgi:hypothetical protein|uniref:hypothetical protein n=1 Tax=Archangium sp. TaxID=1872627 RepID=UPI002ED7FC78